MAQTKRKRRSKHRGNAAGTVETRGRTGRKPTAEEQKKSSSAVSREERLFQEPTLKSSVMRAGFAAVALLVLFAVGIGGKQQWWTSLVLALAAFLLYIPLGYWTDRAVWKRRMRKAGRPLPAKAERSGGRRR
jgi:Flp pilus assembly protein TadB